MSSLSSSFEAITENLKIPLIPETEEPFLNLQYGKKREIHNIYLKKLTVQNCTHSVDTDVDMTQTLFIGFRASVCHLHFQFLKQILRISGSFSHMIQNNHSFISSLKRNMVFAVFTSKTESADVKSEYDGGDRYIYAVSII